MKLNFWQWLAVALLVIGGAWWAYDSMHKNTPAGTTVSPSTQPSQSQ